MERAESLGLLIVLARMDAERKRAIAKHGAKGFRKCRDKIIGPVRATIETIALPPNVVSIAVARSPAVALYLETERDAAQVLRTICAKCGGCEWAKR